MPTHTSLVLRKKESGELLDKGAYIPLDQIIGYPRRSKIEFEDDNELRSLGSMTRGEGAPGTQKRPGRRHGWTSLGVGSYVAYVTTAVSTDRRVAVGLVARNNQEQQTNHVHDKWEEHEVSNHLL